MKRTKEEQIMDQKLKVVGNCPNCGAPVYAKGEFEGSTPPSNVYSCECRNQTKITETVKPLLKHGNRATLDVFDVDG
jgi:hypothetical protein